jgi:hypothetical protein
LTIYGGEATCQTPAHAAGAADVEFTLTDGDKILTTDGYNYIASLSLSFDKSGISLVGAPKQLITDYLTAKVKTDNPSGYNLDIESSDVDLTCINDQTKKILALPNSSAMVDNHWGYAVGSTETIPTNWTGLTALPVTIKTFPTATDLTSGDDTTIWFGARVDYSLPACKYSGALTITVISNR